MWMCCWRMEQRLFLFVSEQACQVSSKFGRLAGLLELSHNVKKKPRLRTCLSEGGRAKQVMNTEGAESLRATEKKTYINPHDQSRELLFSYSRCRRRPWYVLYTYMYQTRKKIRVLCLQTTHCGPPASSADQEHAPDPPSGIFSALASIPAFVMTSLIEVTMRCAAARGRSSSIFFFSVTG